MKQRAVVVVVHCPTGDDGGHFPPVVASALRAYADALDAQTIGLASLEFFAAPNECNVMAVAGASSWRAEVAAPQIPGKDEILARIRQQIDEVA